MRYLWSIIVLVLLSAFVQAQPLAVDAEGSCTTCCCECGGLCGMPDCAPQATGGTAMSPATPVRTHAAAKREAKRALTRQVLAWAMAVPQRAGQWSVPEEPGIVVDEAPRYAAFCSLRL